jgi:hypothetical protein
LLSKKEICIVCCGLVSTGLSAFALGISSAHAAGPTGPGESVGFPGDATVPPDGISGDASAAAEAGKTDFMSLYTGYSYAEDSNFYYLGGSAALNGDSSRRGFLIEGFAGWGDYSYLNSSVPGGKVDADLTELSVLLGYQVFAGKVELSASAGVDWQDTRLSPKDDTNPVAGSETDFIATANMEAPLSERFDFKLYGAYSIVNETYWAKSRIGYKFGESRRFKVGPEGAFYGNENQDSQQVGAFISVPVGKRLDLSFAGGFNFVANDEFFEELESGGRTLFSAGSFGGLGGLTDGGYASVTLSTWF